MKWGDGVSGGSESGRKEALYLRPYPELKQYSVSDWSSLLLCFNFLVTSFSHFTMSPCDMIGSTKEGKCTAWGIGLH